MSLTACGQGDYAEALRFGRQGYELFEGLGHRWGMAASLCRIGFATLGLGRSAEARTRFLEALRLAVRMRHVPLILYALSGMACLLAQEGEDEKAVELFAFIEQHPQTPPIYLAIVRRWFEDVETRLSEGALAAARGRGKASDLESVVEAVMKDGPAGS